MKDHVFGDFGSEISYGHDWIKGVAVFATVTIQLMDTTLLSQIADRIRIEKGHKPMHSMDEYTDDTCDQTGWYDFFLTVSDLFESDSCLEFSVVNSDAQDNGKVYTIDLSLEERIAMYKRMDEECRKYLGQGCKELLAEARRRI